MLELWSSHVCALKLTSKSFGAHMAGFWSSNMFELWSFHGWALKLTSCESSNFFAQPQFPSMLLPTIIAQLRWCHHHQNQVEILLHWKYWYYAMKWPGVWAPEKMKSSIKRTANNMRTMGVLLMGNWYQLLIISLISAYWCPSVHTSLVICHLLNASSSSSPQSPPSSWSPPPAASSSCIICDDCCQIVAAMPLHTESSSF